MNHWNALSFQSFLTTGFCKYLHSSLRASTGQKACALLVLSSLVGLSLFRGQLVTTCFSFVSLISSLLSSQTSSDHFRSFVMSHYAEQWTSTPWQQPDPYESIHHLRSLLCTAESDAQAHNVPQKVCTVVGDILANIEEKIKSHCQHKHLTHVEHRVDATTGRDLVRIWKCTDVQGCTEYSYDAQSCPEGVYYDWQKIDVVNIWIKKVWTTTTSWQMITRNSTEQALLISKTLRLLKLALQTLAT